MGRRSRESNGEALIKVAARLPWWLALLLAVLAYPILHGIAISPMPPVKPGSIPVVQVMVRGLAVAGQFLVPLILVAGAIGSFFINQNRKKLLERVATMPSVETVNGLTWGEFERLVGEVFRCKGFSVAETGQNGPDGGVDLELRKGRELYLVQCKQWRAQRVGVAIVRELAGVMAARGAAGGYVVTSGTFTPDAEEFARGSNITLIGGKELATLITQANQTLNVQRQQPRGEYEPMQVTCPVCGGTMLRRTAKKGVNAGRDFWGCSGYPACRGTLDVV